jgi:hypothetical protein
MQDPDMKTTGYGMVMQLRKNDAAEAGGPSSGFDGVERLDLLKNVNVFIRDVGKSGMPGGAPAQHPAPRNSQAKIEIVSGQDGKPGQTAEPVEPTPLHLSCDSKMQVFLPKSKQTVLVGPPAPPLPTLAKFHRNVVVLRGKEDDGPDQLTSDTLDLTLVPEEKPPQNGTPTSSPDQKPVPSGEGLAQTGSDAQGTTQPGNAGDGNQGLFGGLALQRVHATGHAVWLILPNQGIKLRCNQMIHVRQLPFKPDMTYFRGDRTRPVEIVKVDVVEEDGPDLGKVTGVTNIWTVDATLLVGDAGMDAADVYAHGPGRLETRPDRDQPVERIAIWQDTLIVKNKLGPKNEVLHKVIDLSGNRPCFIDNLQKTSIDSASWIQVWLKPKPPLPPETGSGSTALAGHAGGGQHSEVAPTIASVDQTARLSSDDESSASKKSDSKAGMGGGNLQMEQLHALVDVHLLAPAKTMTARDRLDAEFIEAEATQVASTTTAAKSNDAPRPIAGAPTASDTAAPEQAKEQGQEQVTAHDEVEKPSDDPPMIGSCDRLWARVALKPKSESDQMSRKQTEGKGTKTASTKPGAGETTAEIRKVWMWGNVALHQDPKKEKDKSQNNLDKKGGTDASGEALYLDNRGTNKAITYVYQRDPTEKIHLPGPLPPARVASVERDDIKDITAAGSIKMNQETDQAWVVGPGTLTQLAARGFLTDKAPGTDEEVDENAPDDGADPRTVPADSKVKIRTTSMAKNDVQDEPTTSKDGLTDAKPKTRAGVTVSEKVPMTIGFSENMEFTGRSVDPEGRPAARADFHGIVTAQMEDALLHCTEKMITFTDREVPLTQLGAMSKDQSRSKPDGEATNQDGEAKPQAELSLIFCYRKAVGISRKVDPDLPVPIQQQRIEADDILAYDRRTGDFFVPGKGKVYLYDRSDNASQAPEDKPDGDGQDNGVANSNPPLTATQRTVTPTSGRALSRGRENTGAAPTGVQNPRRAQTLPASDTSTTGEVLPKMLLTQIHFNKGMRGRFGSGKENDKTDHRWSEFYGNVEASRAKVANTQTKLNPDRLPSDGLFLTGQTLRVIQEPPPVGSPEKAPARQYLKAWEKAYAWSNDKVLQADVITYDSYKDLVYAYGEEGHSVGYAKQHAAGQPTSPGSAKAVQLNPKTGSIHLTDSDTIGLLDQNTGYRPTAATPDDPYAKKKKKIKKPFKLPTMNVERRGFTGQ